MRVHRKGKIVKKKKKECLKTVLLRSKSRKSTIDENSTVEFLDSTCHSRFPQMNSL